MLTIENFVSMITVSIEQCLVIEYDVPSNKADDFAAT